MNAALKARILETPEVHLSNLQREVEVGIESNSPQAHRDFAIDKNFEIIETSKLVCDVQLDWE